VFIEGQHATTVAYALGITPGRCLDVTGSLRSGIDALNLAAELVRSGVAARVLVVAATSGISALGATPSASRVTPPRPWS
jgi:3-oxoacyl-[acyl-carrier-protein] synthase III